jgi:hypothetical protein
LIQPRSGKRDEITLPYTDGLQKISILGDQIYKGGEQFFHLSAKRPVGFVNAVKNPAEKKLDSEFMHLTSTFALQKAKRMTEGVVCGWLCAAAR